MHDEATLLEPVSVARPPEGDGYLLADLSRDRSRGEEELGFSRGRLFWISLLTSTVSDFWWLQSVTSDRRENQLFLLTPNTYTVHLVPVAVQRSGQITILLKANGSTGQWSIWCCRRHLRSGWNLGESLPPLSPAKRVWEKVGGRGGAREKLWGGEALHLSKNNNLKQIVYNYVYTYPNSLSVSIYKLFEFCNTKFDRLILFKNYENVEKKFKS